MALALQDDLGIMNQSPAPVAPTNKLGLHDDLGIMTDKPNSFLQDMGNQAVTDIKDVGTLAKNVVQPVLHPIQTVKGIANAVAHPIYTAKAVGQGIADKYGSVDKATETFVNHPFSEVLPDAMMAAGGAGMALKGAGAVSKVAELSKAGDALTGLSVAPIKATGEAIKGVGAFGTRLSKAAAELPENINTLASPIRDYAGNKVNAIRTGAKTYWKSEVDAYGKGLDTLATNPTQVPLQNLMQKLTQTMVDRKLYDPISQKWVKPLTSVDAQLVKSYTQLARNFTNNGTASVGDIIKEYQNIRDVAPMTSSMGREARNVSAELLSGVKNDINIPEFKKLQERYSNFRNNFDAIDKKVDVWGNPMETARGENFLTHGINKTMEARKTAQTIESKTGQSLKGAKALNVVNNLPLKKWLIP